MSFAMSKSSKCCLTCAYWSGQRTVNAGRAECQHNTTDGKCMAHASISNTCSAAYGSNCKKYSPWLVLK